MTPFAFCPLQSFCAAATTVNHTLCFGGLGRLMFLRCVLQVFVYFGSTLLDDSIVTVWEGSTELEFLLSFTLPSTAPGIFEIVIQPKTCSEQCGFGVRFNFRMIDSSLPVLLPPLPSSGALQLTAMLSPIFVSNVDTASLLGVFASYTSTETGVTTSVGAVQWTIDPTRSTVIRLPAVPHPAVANAFGEYTVTLMVSESGINKTVALEHYLLADGTATRVVSFNPSIAPASTTAYGNPVDLRSEINVVLANFVQSLTPQDVRVLFDGEEVEDVLDVEDLAQCSGAVDCERTRIIFKVVPCPRYRYSHLLAGTDSCRCRRHRSCHLERCRCPLHREARRRCHMCLSSSIRRHARGNPTVLPCAQAKL